MKVNNKGFALVSVIISLVVISLMAVVFTNVISLEGSLSVDKYKSTQAYYTAQGGLEYILKRRAFPNYYLLNQQLGGGKFSVYTSNYTGSSINLLVKANVDNYERSLKATISGAQAGVASFIRQGTFLKRSGTGFQNVSGLGFQPKAVIFYWTRQTATGFDVDVNAGLGMATSSSQQSAVSVSMRDGANKSDQGRRYSATNCIIFLTGGGPPTLDSQAAFVSFYSGGFTLNWTTSSANQYIIHYIALGGNIQARVGNFNLTTAGGNQSVTGVGFQPDFLLFNWSYGNTLDANTARSQFGLGFAKSSMEQVALTQAGADNTGNNNDKRWWQRTDSCILSLTTANPPAQDARVTSVSMDTDGFTINKADPPAVTHTIFYLAIKGGQHKVGSFNQPATNGAQTIAGVGFTPDLAIFSSFNLASNLTEQSNGGVTIGSSTASTQSSIWYQDRNVDPSDANMYNIDNRAISLASASALTGQAQLTSFNTDGFNLSWTNCDGTQRQILYWAFNAPPSNIRIFNITERFD